MHIKVPINVIPLFLTFCAFGRATARQPQHEQTDISNGVTVNMKSPHFPQKYENNFRYDLRISGTPGASLLFNSHAFALEFGSSTCPYDYLSINQERFCGTHGPQNYTVVLDSGPVVILRFVTDTSVTFPGLHISFRQQLPVKTPQGDPQSFCGGSLINSGWVLTAAHCCFNKSASRIEILLGTHDLNEAESERVRRSISDVRIHPDYNRNSLSHDFCLVKLTETRSTAIIPACIPDETDPPAGTKCYTTGWGSTSAMQIQQPLQSEGVSSETSVRSTRRKREIPSVLMQVDVRIIDQNTWAVQYQGISIEPNMICAANPGKDSCRGDSGGPLVCQISGSSRYVLFGVTSFRKGCAHPNFPGVYARVSQVVPWIKSIAAINDM